MERFGGGENGLRLVLGIGRGRGARDGKVIVGVEIWRERDLE